VEWLEEVKLPNIAPYVPKRSLLLSAAAIVFVLISCLGIRLRRDYSADATMTRIRPVRLAHKRFILRLPALRPKSA
jgi:hypothetical protein